MEPILPLLAAALTREEAATRGRRLYDALRGLILDGRLAAGRRLPATRTLAAGLGLARNTVAAAYEQLAAEGYVTARVGAGTTVSPALPDGVLVPAAGGRLPVPPPLPARAATALAAAQGARGERGRALLPFRPGVPALDVFPWAEWGRLLGRRWRRPGAALAVGGDVAGLPALREAVAGHLASTRGVVCAPDQVLITTGAQQALDLAARLLLDPGDPVVVEDPGYAGVAAVLRLAGARPCPQPIDAEGLTLPAPGVAARAVVVTPSRNFPLGVTMSLARRLALLEWAAAAGAWVVEDDFDAEFRFARPPLAALQGLDRDGRVLYAGTFTRALFPGLRLGFLVVPPGLAATARAVRAALDGSAGTVAQAALADFIAEGRFAGHLRRLRGLYAERAAALAAVLGPARVPEPPAGGMHLVARLPAGTDDRALARRLGAAGLAAAPLSVCHATPDHAPPGLVLGFAGWPPEVLHAAALRLLTIAGDDAAPPGSC